MAYEYHWEERGFCHRHWGIVTPEDLQEVIGIFCGDPRSDQCKYLIADYSDVEDHTFSDLQINVVAAYDIGTSKTNPTLRQALVAQRPHIREALEHYAAVTARSNITWETKIFDTPTEARRWAEAILLDD